MSIIITALLLVTIISLFLYGTKVDRDNNFFLSKDFTTTIKGIAAVIVVFVHFPPEYQNPLQDLVGSFAYVAVTIFFLFSAYGMLYSVEKKPQYLDTFWINRFANLVIPNWMVNFTIALIIYFFAANSIDIGNLLQLNTYVWVLLAYCVLFYLVELLQRRFKFFSRRVADGILMSIVVVASLVSYFVWGNEGSNWCYERFGLLWGILLFRYMPNIREWLSTGRVFKIAAVSVLCLLMGFCYLKFKGIWFYGEFLLKIGLGLVIVSWIFLCTYRLRIANNVTRFFGNISFEIYLSHVFIMRLIEYYMPGLDSGLFISMTFVVCVAFSALLHQLNRRIIALIRR